MNIMRSYLMTLRTRLGAFYGLFQTSRWARSPLNLIGLALAGAILTFAFISLFLKHKIFCAGGCLTPFTLYDGVLCALCALIFLSSYILFRILGRLHVFYVFVLLILSLLHLFAHDLTLEVMVYDMNALQILMLVCALIITRFSLSLLPMILVIGAFVFFETVIGSYKILAGAPLGAGQIYALLGTDFEEALGYITVHRAVCVSALVAFLVFMGVIIGLLRGKAKSLPLAKRAGIFVAILISCIVGQTIFAAEVSDSLKQRSLIIEYVSDNFTSAVLYKKTAYERLAHLSDIGAVRRDATKAIYVVVIGEATNRNHLHLYGYFRPTTSYLDKITPEHMAVFKNVISSYCTTALSLRRALTLATVASGKEYYDKGVYSLVEIVRAAGFKTYWISNQSQYGVWSEPVSVIASNANNVFFLRQKERENELEFTKIEDDMLGLNVPPDQALLSKIATVIRDESGPAVIFVHTMGSHQIYQDRYLKNTEKFAPQDNAKEFGPKVPVQDINAYDSSVANTDDVLNHIINLLKDVRGVTSLLYFSDHGESPYLQTEHDPARFSRGHVEVPLLMWFSKAYIDTYGEAVKNALAHQDEPFMLDSLSQLAMSWMNISAPFYQDQRSLLSAHYVPTPRLTMDGAVNYDALEGSYCRLVKEKTGFAPGPC